MPQHPENFPASGQDIFAYLAGKYTANNQINCVLKLDTRIDETILHTAVRISLDRQPILGCRLVEDGSVLVWKRREDLDELALLSVTYMEKVDDALRDFIYEPFNSTRDCQVKVKVIRTESDTICIKINHACSDAGGLKQYVNLLMEICNDLFDGMPVTKTISPSYDRSQEQVLRHIPNIDQLVSAVEKRSEPQPTVVMPCNLGVNTHQAVVTGTLPPEQLAIVVIAARKRGVTVNDILLTSFTRALSEVAAFCDNTVSIRLTVDLRRYLATGQTDAVCNLSAGEIITINYDGNDSFDDTLAKISSETQKMKTDNPGIKSVLIGVEMMEKVPFKEVESRFQQRRERILSTKLYIPYFSNVGVIQENPFKLFGSEEVVDCYIVGPGMFSPGFTMLASTYCDALTLAVNFFQSTMPKAVVEQVIDSMLNDLRSFSAFRS